MEINRAAISTPLTVSDPTAFMNQAVFSWLASARRFAASWLDDIRSKLSLSVFLLVLAGQTQAISITLQAWDTSQTNLFEQGIGPDHAGNPTWTNNNLSLEFKSSYVNNPNAGQGAYTFNINAINQSNQIPSPANAVGLSFSVRSSSDPSFWQAGINLGTSSAGGFGTTQMVYNQDGSDPNQWQTLTVSQGGPIPTGDSYGVPLSWTVFQPLLYSFANGQWDVQLYFPDQWVLDRTFLLARFDFVAFNHFGPTPSIDGTIYFDNVSWILSDTLPQYPANGWDWSPTSATPVPTPGAYPLVLSFGFLIFARRLLSGSRLKSSGGIAVSEGPSILFTLPASIVICCEIYVSITEQTKQDQG